MSSERARRRTREGEREGGRDDLPTLTSLQSSQHCEEDERDIEKNDTDPSKSLKELRDDHRVTEIFF
jgi:hypothetical protein